MTLLDMVREKSPKKIHIPIKCNQEFCDYYSGYNKCIDDFTKVLGEINVPLVPLDENMVEQAIVAHVGKGEEFYEVCNTMDLAKMICSKFGKLRNKK